MRNWKGLLGYFSFYKIKLEGKAIPRNNNHANIKDHEKQQKQISNSTKEKSCKAHEKKQKQCKLEII